MDQETSKLKAQLTAKYKEVFGEEYNGKFYFAPGRVNLIGEHTDYNGGYVFPCALSYGTYCLAKKRTDKKLRCFSLNFEKEGVIESSLEDLKPLKDSGWTAYPKAVIWTFIENGYNIDEGMDLLFFGDIPNNAGLSSSAALEVVTGVVIRDLFNIQDVSNVHLALYGQQAENEYIGMKCGIMDQFASAMGKEGFAILLNTKTLDFQYTPIALDGVDILISNTNVKHSLVDSAYNERREQCNKALKVLQQELPEKQDLCDISPEQFELHKNLIDDKKCQDRAKHAINENRRTMSAVYALQCNDIEKFGQLMNESHESLKNDYEVSCDELDVLAETAQGLDGVYGSRMTGGGFGGCTVSLVKSDSVNKVIDTLSEVYKKKCGKDANFYIAHIGRGAGIID